MQIFILDKDIQKNAEYYTDRHVVKILTEVCQILSTVARINGLNSSISQNDYFVHPILYKSTHINHPCVKWTSERAGNFKYVLDLGFALYNEYQYRYNKPLKHQKAKQILNYLNQEYKKFKIRFNRSAMTPFAQAIPDQYKKEDVVEAYREYYRKEKSHLFKWTNRNKPEWIQNDIR